jgi:hypothetical protein
MLVFQPQAVGAAGIWVHNFPYGISIAFNRWGSSDERAIDPPLRFADSDGHRFELYMAHKKIGQINRAAIQIVAISTNYATTLYPTVIWIRSTARNKNSLTMNSSPSYRRSVHPKLIDLHQIRFCPERRRELCRVPYSLAENFAWTNYPAGASAATKRYRGSFQQWGIRLGFTGSCSHISQHRGFNNENSNLLFGSRDDFGVRAAGRNGAGARRGAGRFRFDSAALCYSSAGRFWTIIYRAAGREYSDSESPHRYTHPGTFPHPDRID